uniref:Uncharacterized protein n=1 Tax=Accipiter nisus TaxID=211598 RepID=A0A8B9NGB7_9AVES
MPIQVAQEKLRAEIYDRVNTCNMLLYQLRQRSRARDELKRQLTRRDLGTRGHPVYPASSLPQAVRRLENNIEKMLTKVCAGQKVTALYLAVRDVLRKVSSSSPCHHPTPFPCKGGELKGLNWCQGAVLVGHPPESASSAGSQRSILALAATSPFSDMFQGDMAKMETQFLAEREFRYRSLASQKVHIDRHWLKEASERHLRVVSWGDPAQAGLQTDGRHQC